MRFAGGLSYPLLWIQVLKDGQFGPKYSNLDAFSCIPTSWCLDLLSQFPDLR